MPRNPDPPDEQPASQAGSEDLEVSAAHSSLEVPSDIATLPDQDHHLSNGEGGGESPPASLESPHSWEDEPPELGKMSFLDHLGELRRRIIHSIVAIVIGFVICWMFSDELYAALARPLTQVLRELGHSDQLVYTSPTAIFSLYVHLSLIAGLFVASPYIILQVWKFISPGLYPHERRYAIPFILFCSALLLSGGAFAYAIAFPAALRFLLTFAHRFTPMITANEYFSLATTIILGMALVFELPVLILFLTLLRIVTPGFLLRNVRYAVLLIFFAAAALSPSSDVPNMMLFAAPLFVLYFLGVALSYMVVRLRGRNT
jgi:sec-independent protein translocase protein TatC